MVDSSVTGFGYGKLGVSHLIGPRWTEKEEKQFKLLKVFALVSVGVHFVTLFLLTALVLKVVGCL